MCNLRNGNKTVNPCIRHKIDKLHSVLLIFNGAPRSNFSTSRGGDQAVHLHFNFCFEFLSRNKKIKANQSSLTLKK